MSSKYRADIDGLRAVAILPVIFFHAGLGCKGGFVGVDIFFVISGFLITSLILKEMAEGTFNVALFWERRIRRIFPALAVVMLVSFTVAWFYFAPEDFNWCGQSMVAQTTLLSNVYFWLKLDYFDPGADTKPLLHTWSLAVEEQFYVLFPLLLLFLTGRRRNFTVAAIIWFAMASFALSVAGSYACPKANFYLLPSRAWELLLGALLAAIAGMQATPAWLNETLAGIGISLILWSVFFYTSAMRFPGLAALLPCLGAAFVIFSGGAKTTLVGRVLAWRPLVFIGLISYSLYLWHWPILVFAKYGRPEPLSGPWRLTLLLAAFATAAASWRWIETPFRQRQLCARRRQIFAFAAAGMLILLMLGAGAYWMHGVPSRLPVQAQAVIKDFRKQNFQNNITTEQAVKGQFAELGITNTNRPVTLILWGDSHAMAVAPAIDILCQKYSIRGVEATHFVTPPLLGYGTTNGALGDQPAEFAQATINFIAQNHIKTVFLAAKWSIYGSPDTLDAWLALTIHSLQEAGASAYILKDVPGAPFNVPAVAVTTIIRDGSLDRLTLHGHKYDDRNKDYEQVFQLRAKMGAIILDSPKYFLNSNGFYDVVRDGRILYTDDQHLTVEGSKLLVPMLEPSIRKISQSAAGFTPASSLVNPHSSPELLFSCSPLNVFQMQ
jgi:peptidoglycan/LPS O-acetylase OafA/YrhL